LDPALLEQTRGKTLLTGTGAETARAFYYDRGMPGYGLLGQGYLARPALMARAQRYILQEYRKNSSPLLALAPQIEQRISALLDEKLTQHSEAFQKPSLYLDNFYLQHRVTRMVASGQQLLDEHYQRSHPFLDKDALFYLAHLPVRYKLGSTFHRKAIARLAPKLADIRWDKTDLPLTQGMPWKVRYPALAARVGLPKWGKQTQGMFDYHELLSVIPDSVILRSLNELQCDTDAITAEHLNACRNQLAFAGYSAVWSHLPRTAPDFIRASA
jgi:asparagine synthase (glutamine-hydrolysing)